ncbi:MAG: hypothetical protein P8X74_12720 [Reinekea sp.]
MQVEIKLLHPAFTEEITDSGLNFEPPSTAQQCHRPAPPKP